MSEDVFDINGELARTYIPGDLTSLRQRLQELSADTSKDNRHTYQVLRDKLYEMEREALSLLNKEIKENMVE